MQTIMEILEKFENLIYKFLVWIVLIPKTLLQVVLHPDWAPSYIEQELGEGKSRFDEYFSPVVLLLLVALLPFVFWNFLPVPGIEITSPSTENPTRARNVDFEANITFISTSAKGFVTTFWRVEKQRYDGGNLSYAVLQQDRYTDNPEESNSLDYFTYSPIDTNTIRDTYGYEFSEGGEYWVVVDASKFDSDGYLIETYTDAIQIIVPENLEENVTVYARTKPGETKPLLESVTNQLKSEKTIFLALGLLIPPLLFALAIKLFSKEPLSEDNLKATFYVQCYYFAPIAFIFWATRYAGWFFTPDVFFRYDTDANLIVLLPLVLAVFWFISVQTYAISRERNISAWLALLIVLVCMFILGAGTLIIVFNDDPGVQDVTRKSSIWLYPLLAVGLLTTYHILSIIQKRKEKLAISTGDKVLMGGIVFIIFITMCRVLVVGGREAPLASMDFDVTQRSVAIQSTAELASLESKKFYTEEFNGNFDAWAEPFMTSGDYSQVHLSTENGSLNFQLSQLEDQIPQAYLINYAFLYTDVQVETAVTNNDDSANTVSLLCRLGEMGWYEFEVSNSGFYRIYAFDNQVYTELASGESSAIKTGLSENTYTAICKGNELTLIINGTLVAIVQDVTFNFTEGLIGIAVFSPEGLPVSVDFGYVKMSEPSSAPEASGAVTAIVPSAEAPPTDTPSAATPLSEFQQFYIEEFDGNIDDWGPHFMTSGDESQVTLFQENGSLNFQLSQLEDQIPQVYLMNNAFLYTDVQVEVVTTNHGNNSNGVTLICQFNENGWYEFEVSNSGLYALYTFDNQVYTELASGESSAIKTGLSENTYTAICKGNELTLIINGTPVDTVQDATFNFTEGLIGIAVSSPQGLPVDVGFEYVKVSAP